MLSLMKRMQPLIGLPKTTSWFSIEMMCSYMKKSLIQNQISNYEQLWRDRNNGRLLTTSGLRFICESNNCVPSVGTSQRYWQKRRQ